MQVISGKYRGRKLVSLDTKDTRPTLTRIKESLFDMIQDKCIDTVVLDLFAGSGALGIEALSRGAKHVYFVDKNVDAKKIIIQNLKNINSETYDIMCEDYLNALDKLSQNGVICDLVLLDPPYESGVYVKALEGLCKKNLLKNGSVVCIEQLAKNSLQVVPECYTILKSRYYGEKNITILEYKG